MTLEEALARIEEQDESIDSLANKNKELLTEKRKLKSKYEDIDPEQYNKLNDSYDELKSKYDKLEKQYKTDTEKLSNELSQKDNYLQKTLVEDNLTKTLIEQGLTKEQLAPAIAMLKSDVTISNEDGNYKAVVGDKALNEHTKEWVENQSWLNLGSPDVGANTGGKGDTGGEHQETINKDVEIAKANGDVNGYLQAIMNSNNK